MRAMRTWLARRLRSLAEWVEPLSFGEWLSAESIRQHQRRLRDEQ